MFRNIPKEHDRYITQQALFAYFFGEHSLEEVTRKDFIKSIKVKTRKLQWQEGGLLIVFFMFFALPIIDYIRTERFTDFSMFSIAFSIAMLIFWLVLKTKRINFNVASLIPKMKHPEKFKTFLEYQAAFNQSGLPLLRLTASGYWNSGYLHKADNGILALLGKPKDRAAIRRLSFGWGYFLYPHPDLLMGDKSDTEIETPSNPKQTIEKPDKVHLLEDLILNDDSEVSIQLVTELRGFIFNDKRPRIDVKSRTRLCEIIEATIKLRDIFEKDEREAAVFKSLNDRKIDIDKQSPIVKIVRNFKYDVAENMLRDYLKNKKFKNNGLPNYLRSKLREALHEEE